jgi:ABC-type Mn2+/Zn2+ transport system permease subunit
MSLWDYAFMQRALVAAAVAGPLCALLGVFITLRGMSFFSDAVAHAALTGVALGLLAEQGLAAAGLVMPPWAHAAVLVVFCVGIAWLMTWLFERTALRADTVIAFCFTGSVAFGAIVIGRLRQARDLEAVLFGDVNALAWEDVWALGGVAVLAFVLVLGNLRALTLTTLQPDLARADGIRAGRWNLALVTLVAVTVALLIKMIGALLLSALIVVPAAAGKLLAPGFRAMLWIAMGLGLAASVGGVLVAWQVDEPTGPVIVLVQLLPLAGAIVWRALRGRGAARG